eukprot:scaffold10092_cov66-Phaeocystis_antarctica.AAC.3
MTALLWRGAPSRAEQLAQGSSDERMPVSGRVRRVRPVHLTHRFRKQPRQLRVRTREGGAYQRHAIVRRELRIVRTQAGGVGPMLQLAPRRQSDVYDRRGRGKLQEAPQQPLKSEAVLPSAAVLGVLDLVRARAKGADGRPRRAPSEPQTATAGAFGACQGKQRRFSMYVGPEAGVPEFTTRVSTCGGESRRSTCPAVEEPPRATRRSGSPLSSCARRFCSRSLSPPQAPAATPSTFSGLSRASPFRTCLPGVAPASARVSSASRRERYRMPGAPGTTGIEIATSWLQGLVIVLVELDANPLTAIAAST